MGKNFRSRMRSRVVDPADRDGGTRIHEVTVGKPINGSCLTHSDPQIHVSQALPSYLSDPLRVSTIPLALLQRETTMQLLHLSVVASVLGYASALTLPLLDEASSPSKQEKRTIFSGVSG